MPHMNGTEEKGRGKGCGPKSGHGKGCGPKNGHGMDQGRGPAQGHGMDEDHGGKGCGPKSGRGKEEGKGKGKGCCHRYGKQKKTAPNVPAQENPVIDGEVVEPDAPRQTEEDTEA